MKILILSNKSGAMVDFRYELITELSKENSVVIATPFEDKMEKIRSMPIRIIEVSIDRRGINPFKDARLILKYLRVLKQEQPDIVITYTIKPNIYGGLVCRMKNIPYAANITGLGTSFQNGGLIKIIVTCLYKIALKDVKDIFFENTGNREVLVSNKICDFEKTHILNGAGVNLDRFCYQQYPNNDVPNFLFVGRVMKEKGVDELFAAMKQLNAEGRSCFLNIVGPCEEGYEEILHKYEKLGWLKYHGYQEDVIPFIRKSDCFVLPSYHEGMANTNLECASSGRPIITSNIPGCKEAVIEGITGFTCMPKNFDSLYKAMLRMLELNQGDRIKMGKAGRKHMEDFFDRRKVVQETVEVINL